MRIFGARDSGDDSGASHTARAGLRVLEVSERTTRVLLNE